MIKTRQDLKHYLKEDCKANTGKTDVNIIKYLIGLYYKQENILAYRYLKALRHREYHINNKSLYHKIAQLYYRIKQHRLGHFYGIQIHPNTVREGLYLPHMGGVIINCKSMGYGCIVSTGVVIGNKALQENRATIGNNVQFCVGCKVIGKVTIGDNAIIAPNTVVIKDVPSGTIVSGIPAEIIKKR